LKNKIKILIFLVLAILSNNLFSQSKIETLQENLFSYIDKNGNDATALSLTKEIYSETIEIDPLTAHQFAAMGQQIAIELGDSIEIGIMYGYLGNALLEQKTYFMAMDAYFAAYEIFTKFNSKKNIANALINIGRTYLAQEIYSLSEDKLKEAQIIFQELNDKKGEAEALKQLGLANITREEDIALQYFEKSLELLDNKKDILIIAEIKSYIAQTYMQMYEIDLAIENIEKALQIFEKLNEKIKIANAKFLFAEIYLEDENIHKAMIKFQEALIIFEKLKSLEKVSKTYQKLAEIYFLQEKYPKAIVFANRGLINAENFNYLPIRRDIYYTLSNSYSKLDNYKTAFSLQQQYAEMINMIYEEKKQSQFSDFQMNLETQNKEKEIDFLKIQAEKDKLQAAQKQYKRNTIFVILLAILILTFIISLYMRFREKSKSNRLLQDSNTHLKTQIEERKIAQIELQNSEERYRLVFRKTPIGIMQFNSDLKITDANDRFSDIFNISIDEMVGTELTTIFDRKSVYGFNNALTSKDVKTIKNETEIITNGQVIYISLTIKPYSYNTKEGNVKGGVVIIEDLTEFKKAEKFYNKTVIKKQNLLNLYPENLIYINKNGDIITSHMPSSPDVELNSKHINEIIPKEETNKLFNEINTALNKKIQRNFILNNKKTATKSLVKIVPGKNNHLLIILSDFNTFSADKKRIESDFLENKKEIPTTAATKKEKYYEDIYNEIEKDLLPAYQNLQKQLSFIVLKGFAEKIIKIGEKYNNLQIKEYGILLLEYITTFNIAKVNESLSLFPSLISDYINQEPINF